MSRACRFWIPVSLMELAALGLGSTLPHLLVSVWCGQCERYFCCYCFVFMYMVKLEVETERGNINKVGFLNREDEEIWRKYVDKGPGLRCWETQGLWNCLVEDGRWTTCQERQLITFCLKKCVTLLNLTLTSKLFQILFKDLISKFLISILWG